jgi:acyl-CoA thioesterase FadM
VRTRVAAHSGARLSFDYEILCEGSEDAIATGFTAHAAVDARGRPRRLPPELLRLIE